MRTSLLIFAIAACSGKPRSTSANAQLDQSSGVVASSVNLGAPCNAPRIQTGENTLDDYSPYDETTLQSCAGFRTWLLMSGDNEGSFVTGLSVGQQIGDVHLVCNQGAQIDALAITFRHEDAHSAPENRFDTPNRGDYILGADTCVEISYQPTRTANCGPGCAPGGNRWVIHGSGHAASMLVDSLQLMGAITPAPVTGTLDDWAPVGSGPEAYPSGFCLGGNSCLFRDNTVVRITTADATGVTITGLEWLGVASTAGQGPVKALVNYGPGAMTLANADGGSAIGNQLVLPHGSNLICPSGSSVVVYHANIDGGWIVLAQSGCSTAKTTLSNVTVNGMLAANTLALGPAVASALGPGTTNDWNATSCDPSGAHCIPTSSVVRATTTGVATAVITGMVGPGGGWYPGLRQTICNFGPGVLQLTHQDPRSSAGNRFFLAATTSSSTTLTIQYGQCQDFLYDTYGLWIPIGGTAGSDHPAHNGATPTLANCGTNPSAVSGDDAAGYFTIGAAATGCTLTFANPWNQYNPNAVHCVVTNRSGATLGYTPTTSTLTLASTGDLSNVVIDYACSQ